MKTIRKLDKLLSVLTEQIFQPLGVQVPLVYRQAESDDRAAMVASDRADWTPVGRDHIWGEPDGYYWFGGKVALPDGIDGARIFGRIEAAFGNVMGRSDPQCLVRVDGRIVQGGDANHREFPLSLNAVAGHVHDILIEAGTIEDRRQIGFAVTLHRHDPQVEDVYYDLRVPLDVARLLDENDPRRHFILRVVEQAVDAIDLRPGGKACRRRDRAYAYRCGLALAGAGDAAEDGALHGDDALADGRVSRLPLHVQSMRPAGLPARRLSGTL